MDGTNASTAFVDSGPNALAVTAVGNAQISTTQSRFGGASGLFDASGNTCHLTIPGSSLFDMGSSDFTIECWIRSTQTQTAYTGLVARSASGGSRYALGYNSAGTGLELWVNGINSMGPMAVNTATINDGNWHHIAAVRYGTDFSVYVDGVKGSTSSTSSGSISSSTNIVYVANDPNFIVRGFRGYIDDLRITKYARYTSAFTPPAAALPDIYNPNTTLPVTGAALWLDASQQNTLFTDAGTTPVTTSGQSIYQWNDLSGNNRHAVQATSGSRPTWVPPASGQNGLGVTSFNGSNNFFVGQWQNFTDLTLFIVARNTNAFSPGGRIFSQSDDTYADNVQTPTTTYIPAAVASTSQFLSTNISQQVILSVSFPNNTYQRFIHRRTGTTGSNTVGSTTTAGTIGTVTRNMTRYCMGRTTNGTDGNWAGQICEVIAFPRQLASGEEASINSYLNTKWGTP
jgi:hypothetical protein